MDNGTDKRGSLDEQNQLVDDYIKLMGIGYTIDTVRVDETVDEICWRISFVNLPYYIKSYTDYISKNDAIASAENYIRNWVIHYVLNKTTTKGE
jgi:hypothetical protein